MASLRSRRRADGTTAYAVVYIHDGRQTSVTFDSEHSANEFLCSIKLLGADRAMKAFGIAPTIRAVKARPSGVTVADWVATYIASRSGVAKSTLYDYEAILRNDIKPHPIGGIPLELLARGDVVAWVNGMTTSGKTIANKHGFLSAALTNAVLSGLIAANVAAGTRLPRTEKPENVFLTQSEFAQLLLGFTARWHPLLKFLVTSGTRFGEAAALRAADIDPHRGTVNITRTWKRTYDKVGDSYELGAPKTARSVRTINVATEILDGLDYSHEWLFTNTRGGPLRVSGWRTNVWYPSVDRAVGKGLKKRPRIHDMRHACASWMIAQGTPLPVIQRHLGHESITTTVNLYGHLDRKDAESAATAIAASMRTEPPL